MNKKFSTLLATAMLATTFSAVAADASIAPDKVEAGSYYYIGNTDGYLTIGENGAKTAKDSIMFSQKANADLWTLTKGGYDEATGVQRYVLTNKNGVVLSVAKSDKAPYSIREGIKEFQFAGSASNGFDISAAVKAGKVIYLNSGVAKDVTIPTSAGSTKVNIEEPGKALMSAETISDFSVFTLVANPAVTKNPFDGVVVRARNVDANGKIVDEATGENWIKFELAEKPGFFIGVDTTFTTIHAQKDIFGVTLKADSTYAKNDKHTVANNEYQMFRVTKDLKNGKMTLVVKKSPVKRAKATDAWTEVSTNITNGDSIVLKYAKIDNLNVLTASVASAFGGNVVQGNALSFTQTPGTPASLPNGAGVYFLKNKNTHNVAGNAKNANLNKYYGAKVSEFVSSVSNFNREGQYYVAEKDGRYAVVSRMQGADVPANAAQYALDSNTGYREIYKVGDGLYTFNGNDTIQFIYAKEVNEAKDRFLGYKSFTKEDIKNEAFALNLVSGTPGVDGLYAYAKDSLISIKSATFDDAIRFKVKAVELEKWSRESATDAWSKMSIAYLDNAGAQILKDTLSAVAYTLNEQYTKNTVTNSAYDTEETYAAVKFVNRDAVPFVFKAIEAADEYLMVPVKVTAIDNATASGTSAVTKMEEESFKVVFNVKTAALTYVAQDDVRDDFFKFEKAAAPDYANLGAPSHKILSSSEGDGKALSMNPTTLFAEVKTAEQTPYIDSLFGLWIDTACVKDITKPLYYVTTGNGLSAEDREAGFMYYLVNPYDSAYVANSTGDETANMSSAYLLKDFTDTYAKAAFVKAKVYGVDSLTIVREKATAADTLKNMSINPAAMAFMTTPATDGLTNLIVENTVNTFNGKDGDDAQQFDSKSYYLKVINNVLVWSSVPTDAHLFNVASTELHPTSNDNVADGASTISVVANAGTVTIQGAAGKSVVISNILGKVVAETVLSSDNATIAVPAGIVAVAVEGEAAVKVVVK